MLAEVPCCLFVGLCDSGPCANGGSCSVEDGAVACECAAGYFGNQCEESEYLSLSNSSYNSYFVKIISIAVIPFGVTECCGS